MIFTLKVCFSPDYRRPVWIIISEFPNKLLNCFTLCERALSRQPHSELVQWPSLPLLIHFFGRACVDMASTSTLAPLLHTHFLSNNHLSDFLIVLCNVICIHQHSTSRMGQMPIYSFSLNCTFNLSSYLLAFGLLKCNLSDGCVASFTQLSKMLPYCHMLTTPSKLSKPSITIQQEDS